jgi:hypothetical protein
VVLSPREINVGSDALTGMDIDTEELISSLTPREENDAIKSYQNTVAVACPACGEPFHDLVVCKQNPTSLNLSKQLDLCVGVDDGQAFIFTHQ